MKITSKEIDNFDVVLFQVYLKYTHDDNYFNKKKFDKVIAKR